MEGALHGLCEHSCVCPAEAEDIIMLLNHFLSLKNGAS